MKSIAAHTLGCKVNQYDTQAMLELFISRGYQVVSFDDPADIYLLNTCTVTGIGDKKSFQLIRRIKRDHPDSFLIVCGCMAQQRGEELLSCGADLVLGTQRRSEIVDLVDRARSLGKPLCAVTPLTSCIPFERLSISSQNEHTRASLKIQEGCNNKCTYCIIPAVRGPIRSRPLEDIRSEVLRLRDAGYRELVLTGIHLSSYGLDLNKSVSLLDVIQAIQDIDGILRIRLGSLEPTVATPAFAAALKDAGKICPQFHLALQSGSDSVLRRMKRRYNTLQYINGIENLRLVFPHAAFTTDILTGFPGETESELNETKSMITRIGFARIHVFPYSPRPGTEAALMPGQLSSAEKEKRVRELISLGDRVSGRYLDSWIGQEAVILPEEKTEGCWEGYTPEYIRVRLNAEAECVPGIPVRVRLKTVSRRSAGGLIISEIIK